MITINFIIILICSFALIEKHADFGVAICTSYTGLPRFIPAITRELSVFHHSNIHHERNSKCYTHLSSPL